MLKILMALALLWAMPTMAGATRTVDADSIKSADHTKTFSFPSATATLVGLDSTQTLTNKTMGSACTWNGNALASTYLPATTMYTDAANTFSTGPQSLGSQTLSMQVANASSTGTTANKLAKLTGAPSKAVITSTSDTSGAIGIVVAGAGTTGSADIAQTGQASCVFDGATTAGDYVQISATTGGDCHDAGASLPSSGQILGRVLSTNGAGGTYSMVLFGNEIIGTSATNGVTSNTSSVRINWASFGDSNGTLAAPTPCTGSNCTIYAQSGSWLTTAAWQTTGSVKLSIANGEYTQTPVCIASCTNFNAANLAGNSPTSANGNANPMSATAVGVGCMAGNGTATNGSFHVICVGLH